MHRSHTFLFKISALELFQYPKGWSEDKDYDTEIVGSDSNIESRRRKSLIFSTACFVIKWEKYFPADKYWYAFGAPFD